VHLTSGGNEHCLLRGLRKFADSQRGCLLRYCQYDFQCGLVALELSTVAPAYATNPVKSSPSQECETTPAPLYSSVATTTTASTWSPVPDYIYNDAQTTPGFLGTGTTTTGGCIAGAALPATMPVTVSTPVVYVSFIVVDESASGLSGVGTDIFTLGFSMNLA